MMKRGDHMVRLTSSVMETGHSPFLSSLPPSTPFLSPSHTSLPPSHPSPPPLSSLTPFLTLPGPVYVRNPNTTRPNKRNAIKKSFEKCLMSTAAKLKDHEEERLTSAQMKVKTVNEFNYHERTLVHSYVGMTQKSKCHPSHTYLTHWNKLTL